MSRILLALTLIVTLGGCLQRAAALIDPQASEGGEAGEGGGTLTCREIVETCDANCTDPLCLHGCTAQGAPTAQPQHDALLSCGQRNGCTDEECMRANCMPEWESCEGPAEAAPAETPAT